MNMLSGVRSRIHSRRFLAAFTSVLALSAVVVAIPLAAPAGAALAPLRLGSVPLVPKGAVPLGSLATSTVVTIDIALKPRDPAALAAYATAVSTPGSSLYRDYLPAGAFPQKFGPTSATISSVAKWLRVQGLRPSAISADHLIFPVTATVGQLERAFSINLVRYNLGDRTAFSNTASPLITGAVAGAVQGIIGLSNINLAQHQSILSAPSTEQLAKPRTSPRVYNAGPTPCTDAVDDGEDYDAYTANQLATAYSFTSLYNASDLGAGQTVALFELEPNETSDISAYESCYGISTSVTYTKEDGGAGSGAGSGEAALDIEDVAGLAPGVKIDVYQAPNSETGLIDNYTAIVDADTAKVVSTSWGLCEPLEGSDVISEENTIFEQAAAQGQSVFAAAGDHGSEDCSASNGSASLAVDDPASQPFVTGVGGTSLSAIGPPPTESVWNESATSEGAGGGGISSSWTMPSYQSGAPSTLNVNNSN
jgi:subtilase family serine protease